MTRDEIMAMEAGPEMDAIVGTKIMRIEAEWSKQCPCPYCGTVMYGGGDHHRAYCTPCGEWRYGPHKCYSECIEDAWEVVDALADMRIALHIETLPRGEVAIEIFRVKWDYDDITGPAPLAICRAALIATMEGSK